MFLEKNNKMLRKSVFFIGFLGFIALGTYAQGFNSNKVALTNFLVRMYNNAPFEGIRAIDDYENAYLISVLALDKSKYKTESALNRVASVKAMAQASSYLNGSTISQEMIIHTSEKVDKDSDVEIVEIIRENSVGYVKALEQLTNFTRADGMQVFIFIKQIDK